MGGGHAVGIYPFRLRHSRRSNQEGGKSKAAGGRVKEVFHGKALLGRVPKERAEPMQVPASARELFYAVAEM
jgi:hypothetical protein